MMNNDGNIKEMTVAERTEAYTTQRIRELRGNPGASRLDERTRLYVKEHRRRAHQRKAEDWSL